MKPIKQLLILAFLVITTIACDVQFKSNVNDIKTEISSNDVSLEIPERQQRIEMSFGYNNAFRIRPTKKFVINP